jgi:hypothetical protein
MKTMITSTRNAADNTWLPPSGLWFANLNEIKTDTDQIRLIFKIANQQGLSQDYMAGKTFKMEQYNFLLRDLIGWIGSGNVQSLCENGKLPFKKLRGLIGKEALVEIELVECGQAEKFRNIKSIKSCDENDEASNAGIDLSAMGWRWN